jgi:flagellar hook-associated protein 1 FlgK
MSTINSILNSARNGIRAHQAALATVSHNLANAETPGYSRQRVELVTSLPVRLPSGSFGNGVDIGNVVRLREQLLDANYRREAANRGGAEVTAGLLAEIEGILGEPGELGLANTLDQFWNAWSDLSNSPGNPGVQSVVRERGLQVVQTFNAYSWRIGELADRARLRLVNTVDEINAIAREIAELNVRITAAEVGGNEAPDLRDQRDILGDRLAHLAGARVEPQQNGTMGVYIGSMMLVDAANARTLEVRASPTLSLGLKGDPDPLVGVTGVIRALVDVVATEVPAVRGRLDQLARAIVNGVNEYHASGWTATGDALGGSNWNPLLGPTGSRVDFFDPAFVTAGSMRVSGAVIADARVIAAGDVQNAPGNTNVALALAALRDDSGIAALATRLGANFATLIGLHPGESYADHFTQTVTALGVSTAEAETTLAIFDTLTQQAESRRASVSGVSIDEELTQMLRHQQAYVAATRMVRVADEMAQAVLAMV